MQNRSNREPGKPVWVMVIIMDPHIKGNRDFPFDIDFYEKGDVDLILTSSGHADDQGNAVPYRKPDERHVRLVLERLSVTPKPAALIDRFRGLPGGRRKIATSLVSP